jgi:hypothetical protein
MKQRVYNRIILFFTLILCSFSCSSDLDFDQVNDFNSKPVFTTNLAYFKLEASDFVINDTEQHFFSYITNVDFFNTPFVESDLVKTELYFRIKNTIARSYIYNITFLDQNDAPIHLITIDVAAYNGTEVLVEKTETFTTADVEILKRTTKMVFSIIMSQGPPLATSSSDRVELSSSITAYFDVK